MYIVIIPLSGESSKMLCSMSDELDSEFGMFYSSHNIISSRVEKAGSEWSSHLLSISPTSPPGTDRQHDLTHLAHLQCQGLIPPTYLTPPEPPHTMNQIPNPLPESVSQCARVSASIGPISATNGSARLAESQIP